MCDTVHETCQNEVPDISLPMNKGFSDLSEAELKFENAFDTNKLSNVHASNEYKILSEKTLNTFRKTDNVA